jgi:excisionase family DNA binding protein
MEDDDLSQRLLTIKEVSQRTGVPRWRLYQSISEGHGPPVVRMGRAIRVSEVALQRWIEGEQEVANE